jgi:hypothetical protein
MAASCIYLQTVPTGHTQRLPYVVSRVFYLPFIVMAFASSFFEHHIVQTVLLHQPPDAYPVRLVIRQHDGSRAHPKEKEYAQSTMGLPRKGQDTPHRTIRPGPA